jgi:hypothetical protein
MDKQLIGLLAAFILGYLVLGQLFRRQMDSLLFKIQNEWWPVRCWQCHHWLKIRHARFELHQIAGTVKLCQECSQKLHSYTGAKQ